MSFLKGLWDEKDAERGVALGLIVGTVISAVFATSDYLALNFDYIRGLNPYGVLWFWLNPYFWTDIPYRIYTTAFLFVAEGLMYWFFVRTHKLSKFLFYAGWFQNMVWMKGTVFQNITVTAFAPLGSLFPWLIIPFMLLQKIPLGWSWNFSDGHWWCAFVGNQGITQGDTVSFVNGQTLISCPGGWLRWNPAYSWFWSYAMIVFWVVFPLLWYLKKRNRGKWMTYAHATGADWKIQKTLSARMMDGMTWFCSFCGEEMKVDYKHEYGIWFDGEWLCWECVDSCPGCYLPTMYCICDEDQCAKDIAVDRAQAALFRSGLWE